jgi:hypothetical protein
MKKNKLDQIGSGIETRRYKDVNSNFIKVIERIPKGTEPHPLPDWLHYEILERYRVLIHAKIEKGMNVLEIGAGAHAIATVPLAFMVGETGHVDAIELERWSCFNKVITSTGLKNRVTPITHDATDLPFPFRCFDLAVCVHGIRSLRNELTIIRVLKEMLRVSDRIFIAESLPVARTKGQKAHLEMYDLREEIFEAISGIKDDIHYYPLEKLEGFVERAGGRAIESEMLNVDLPHFLAFISKEYLKKIKDKMKREDLLRRWEVAHKKIQRYGEEHPPIGIVSAKGFK